MSIKMSREEFREIASYASYMPFTGRDIQYCFDFFEKIAFPHGEKTEINPKYANFSCDAIEKLGFMFLSYETITAIDDAAHALCPIPAGDARQKQLASYLAQIKYHTYMFIWSTRALLDALSVHLNGFWSLGQKNSGIWLGNEKFLEKLELKRNSLYKKIICLNGWFEEVDRYRLYSIHREPLLVIPNVNSEVKGDFHKDWDICIPAEAKSNFVSVVSGIKIDLIPLHPILKRWLDNAEKINKIVYEDTLEVVSVIT